MPIPVVVIWAGAAAVSGCGLLAAYYTDKVYERAMENLRHRLGDNITLISLQSMESAFRRYLKPRSDQVRKYTALTIGMVPYGGEYLSSCAGSFRNGNIALVHPRIVEAYVDFLNSEPKEGYESRAILTDTAEKDILAGMMCHVFDATIRDPACESSMQSRYIDHYKSIASINGIGMSDFTKFIPITKPLLEKYLAAPIHPRDATSRELIRQYYDRMAYAEASARNLTTLSEHVPGTERNDLGTDPPNKWLLPTYIGLLGCGVLIASIISKSGGRNVSSKCRPDSGAKAVRRVPELAYQTGS